MRKKPSRPNRPNRENKGLPVQDLFDAFFVLLESDEWETWEEELVNQDLMQLMKASIPWFKFPRCSFANDGKRFEDERVSNAELQILALIMKSIWYGRVLDSWENLRPLYTERDFSPAAQMKQFSQRDEEITKRARELEAIYYRSIDGSPFNYRGMVGRKKGRR